MPIVRVDSKGKKRKTSRIVAAATGLGVALSICVFLFYDKDVGFVSALVSNTVGTVWSLIDE